MSEVTDPLNSSGGNSTTTPRTPNSGASDESDSSETGLLLGRVTGSSSTAPALNKSSRRNGSTSVSSSTTSSNHTSTTESDACIRTSRTRVRGTPPPSSSPPPLPRPPQSSPGLPPAQFVASGPRSTPGVATVREPPADVLIHAKSSVTCHDGTSQLDSTILNGGTPGSEKLISLRIKTLDSKEHLMEVDASCLTVSELKSKLSRSLPGAEGKFLRLITQGKLLTPDTASLESFRISDRAVVHCVFSDQPPRAHIRVDLERGAGSGEVEYPDVNDDPAQRRGFDRLRTHGFSIQEVAALRSYFNAQVVAYAASREAEEGPDAETAEDRRLRMEDEWMGRQGEESEFALNTNRVVATRAVFAARRGGMEDGRGLEMGTGTSRDFLYGFIMVRRLWAHKGGGVAGLHKNPLPFLSSSVAAQTVSYFSSYSPAGVCAGIYLPVLALERSSNPHAEDGHHPGCLLFPRLEHHPTRGNGGRDGGRRGGRE